MSRQYKLTYDQELVIRNFIGGSEFVELTYPPKWLGLLYNMMGYKIAPNGARVHNDTVFVIQYGTPIDNLWEDTYEADWKDVTRPETDANASASQPTEGN